MSNIKNITVTDARLRKAVQNVSANTRQNTTSSGLVAKADSCTLIEATLVKWFIGVDKVIILVNDEEVEASINYPFIDKEFIISVTPMGNIIEDEEGSYIEPKDVKVNVLKHGEKYCVLGFKQGDSTKSADIGEILLQAGNTCVNISPYFININTDALFINGVKYEK